MVNSGALGRGSKCNNNNNNPGYEEPREAKSEISQGSPLSLPEDADHRQYFNFPCISAVSERF